MSNMLTCPECGRGGFKRLTKHLSQMHGLTKTQMQEQHPGIVLEVTPPTRDVPCVSCGDLVRGYSGRAVNVKCAKCRRTPAKRQRGGGDTKDLVACRICGVQRRRLGRHIKTAHNLTPDEYMEQFPDALIEVPGNRTRSLETRAKQSAAATHRWTDRAARAAQSERLKESAPWKGKHLSKEHRQAISEGGRGVPHDITEEDRQRRAERGRRVLREIRAQPGYRDKLSKAQIKRARQDPEFGFRTPGRWQKAYKTRKANGTLNPPGVGRGINGFRKGLTHYCRSTLEANFARILLFADVPYEYEPVVVRLRSGKTYTPDFRLLKPLDDFVPAGWLELKGWRDKDGALPPGTLEKAMGFERATGEPVTIITMHDEVWKQIRARYKPLLAPLWEGPRHNLRTHPDLFAREPEAQALQTVRDLFDDHTG